MSLSSNDRAGILYQHPEGYRLRRGRNWFFLGLTYASYYLCRYNLGAIAPELKRDLNLDNAGYGKFQTARDGAYAIGQFINGLFTDKVGGKRAMTIGAVATAVLNLAFGLTSWGNFTYLVPILISIRALDGYMQAFGAPGMIKINTAWFRREERGGFAGIFGGMIQLGAIGSNYFAKVLTHGFSIPLVFFTLTVPELDWRYMFFVPPAIVLVIIVLMNLAVKNNPEEAGYTIRHDDEPVNDDPNEQVSLGVVFRKIASNKTVWIVAGAYFCTGFVRRAIESWWVIYLESAWDLDKLSVEYGALAFLLPFTAFAGSFSSGWISDKVFRGQRAVVATVLYGSQTLFCILAAYLTQMGTGSVFVMLLLLVLINTMCNATHSILGTAAAMDLGGRKMAGFSSGVIDSFQYYGAMLSGYGLGVFIDHYAKAELLATRPALDIATVDKAELFHGLTWFVSMIPFGVVGTVLMLYVWLVHDRRKAKTA